MHNKGQNSDAPRPSISSGRSKKSEADFEAALLNPNQTIFLSAGPHVEHEEGVSPSLDGDAPVPVEKRSYDDDLKSIGRKSQNGAAGEGDTKERGRRKDHWERTPELEGQEVFGVIPPTPTAPGALPISTPKKSGEQSAAARKRRVSQGTTYDSPSKLSTISTSSPRKGSSVGIDGMLPRRRPASLLR